MPLSGRTDGAEPQYAALPWRLHAGRLQILLLTSRDTGRWVIPKGWPKQGLEPWQTAAEEAYEEGGVHGRIEQTALGWYDYRKRMDDSDDVDCQVTVYAMEVQSESYTYPECDQRERRWIGARQAAGMVDEARLRRLIRNFIRRQMFRKLRSRLTWR